MLAPCPPGHKQFSTAATSCDRCDEGTIAPNPQSAVCIACEPGRWASGRGRSSCDLCPVGRAGTGLKPCHPCAGANFQKFSGRISCESCGVNQWLNAKSECVARPPGAACDAIAAPQSTEGFYVAVKSNGTMLTALPCLPKHCVACNTSQLVNGTNEPVSCCAANRDPTSPLCGSPGLD